MTDSDCFQVVAHSRELAESSASGNYDQVRFYGAWLVHNELSHGKHLQRLRAIDAVIAREAAGEKLNLCTEVSRILSVEKLRRELGALRSANALPTDVIDGEANWLGFLNKILTALVNKPIIDPGPSSVNTAHPAARERIRSLRLVPETDSPGATIQWRIELATNFTATGVLLIRE